MYISTLTTALLYGTLRPTKGLKNRKSSEKKSQVYLEWLLQKIFSIIRHFQETIYGSQKTSNTNNRNFQNIKWFKSSFKKDIFHYWQNKSHKKHNFHVHSRNTSRYGNNSRCVLGAHIWDSLPENIKPTDSVYELKNFLKGWYGCKCYLCIV